MPNIVSANTNAPTMALADRAMSLLLSEGAAAARSSANP
jgi:choline dehydrogenase-like flavoprotein